MLIKFLDEVHEARYRECVKRDATSEYDTERQAFFYVLAGNKDIWSKDIASIYDFDMQVIKPEEEIKKLDLCSSSKALLFLALNLFNGYILAWENALDPVSLFKNLDSINVQLALNALSLRFSIK